MKVLAINKRARYDYEILDSFEAGLVLTGQEVKSIKTGHISLKGAYVTIKDEEAYVINMHVPPYRFAGPLPSYDPYRTRKLLLHKKELKRLIGKRKEKGLTLVPTRIYLKKGLIKLEFGIGRGKKQADKREDIKKRDTDREIRRQMRVKE